jgi:hypothetical protein
MRGADLLLLLSVRTADPFYVKGFYPAKVFEYFGARRPILCVPGDRGLLDELLGETRTGVVCETAKAVADYLCRAARERVPYEPDAGVVERYTRRNLSGQLARVLDGVVEAR